MPTIVVINFETLGRKPSRKFKHIEPQQVVIEVEKNDDENADPNTQRSGEVVLIEEDEEAQVEEQVSEVGHDDNG